MYRRREEAYPRRTWGGEIWRGNNTEFRLCWNSPSMFPRFWKLGSTILLATFSVEFYCVPFLYRMLWQRSLSRSRFASALSWVNAFGIEILLLRSTITSTCLAQSRSHRSPLQRIVLFPKLETCKPLIWKYSFISFLLDRTTTTVISCPYFAVNSISVTPRFPEKPTSCRFCVVRRGPYSFPCAHVIDSDSNTVSLLVNYEGTESAIFNDCIKRRDEHHIWNAQQQKET